MMTKLCINDVFGDVAPEQEPQPEKPGMEVADVFTQEKSTGLHSPIVDITDEDLSALMRPKQSPPEQPQLDGQAKPEAQRSDRAGRDRLWSRASRDRLWDRAGPSRLWDRAGPSRLWDR